VHYFAQKTNLMAFIILDLDLMHWWKAILQNLYILKFMDQIISQNFKFLLT
jgi:hypothetical protein